MTNKLKVFPDIIKQNILGVDFCERWCTRFNWGGYFRN